MFHFYRLEEPDDVSRMTWLHNPWNLLSMTQLYDELGYYTCLMDNGPSTDEEHALYVRCLHQVVQEIELRQSKYNWH